MAAGRLTPETRRRLEQLCDQDVAAGFAFNRCNSEFHVTIAIIGGNRRMAETLGQLLAQMERLFLLRYPPIRGGPKGEEIASPALSRALASTRHADTEIAATVIVGYLRYDHSRKPRS
jgi:DNA-binding GntR family transcriptional regulator